MNYSKTIESQTNKWKFNFSVKNFEWRWNEDTMRIESNKQSMDMTEFEI